MLDIKFLVYRLKEYYSHAEDTEKIILNCAIVAGSSDAVGSVIPVLAIPSLIISSIGAVWFMYGKLCETLGISLKKNVLKLLARAALANISANLGGALAAMIVGLLIPGASIVVSAIVSFIAVYLAGIIFLSLILKLAEASNDLYSFSDISKHEMKEAVSTIKPSIEDLNKAKDAFDKSRSN